jgi:hypothetical protein
MPNSDSRLNPGFSPNDSFLYAITAIVIVFIAVQSAFFLVRAWRRAKAIGVPAATLHKTVISSAVYTLAPAVSILLGVIALSKSPGLPLPWLRLSVIGAITYETAAAASATNALGLSLAGSVGILALMGALIAIGASRVLYKKNLL